MTLLFCVIVTIMSVYLKRTALGLWIHSMLRLLLSFKIWRKRFDFVSVYGLCWVCGVCVVCWPGAAARRACRRRRARAPTRRRAARRRARSAGGRPARAPRRPSARGTPAPAARRPARAAATPLRRTRRTPPATPRPADSRPRSGSTARTDGNLHPRHIVTSKLIFHMDK